jgi:hypothetical protein
VLDKAEVAHPDQRLRLRNYRFNYGDTDEDGEDQSVDASKDRKVTPPELAEPHRRGIMLARSPAQPDRRSRSGHDLQTLGPNKDGKLSREELM